MRRIISAITILFFVTTLFGQSSSDAIDFSQVMYQGTAKATGMANALGAVGGDQTSICINPAGMGLYRSNELNMSLGLLCNTLQSSYYGTDETSSKFKMNIPNVGFVTTKEKSNYDFIRFTQFGISLNRTNDYNLFSKVRGLNPNSSLIDNYLCQIDGKTPFEVEGKFPYTIYPTWHTYLIDTLHGYYVTPVPQGNLWQSNEWDMKGRSEEWTFSASANCMDRLYIGASLGIAHLKRIGTRTYKEEVPSDFYDYDFRFWTFEENLSSSGGGINLKLGFIYHANTWLRFGASFHSPTIYSIDESWQTETIHQRKSNHLKYISPSSKYNYYLFTPLKWVGSVAFIGHNSMLSLDAEYTNYGSSFFKCTIDDYFDYSDTNEEISNNYGRALNIRIGAERMMRSSYIRAGVAYYGSPFGFGKSNGSIKKASVGFSLVASEYVIFDFAYELTHGVNEYYIYTLYDENGESIIDPVNRKQFRSNAVASMRVKF